MLSQHLAPLFSRVLAKHGTGKGRPGDVLESCSSKLSMYKAGDRAAITTHFSYRGTIIIIAVVRTGRGRDVGYPIAAKTTKRGTERERMGTKPGTKGLKTNVYCISDVKGIPTLLLL